MVPSSSSPATPPLARSVRVSTEHPRPPWCAGPHDAREHGRHGIRSNIVCPGLVIPEGPEAVGASSLWAVGQDDVFNPKQIDFMLKDTPLRRLTNAEDIGRAVL